MAAAPTRGQRHFLIIEDPRPFTRIRATDRFLGNGPGGHQTGTQQALHIKYPVKLGFADFPHQTKEALGAGIALKNENLVHRGAGLHDWRKNILKVVLDSWKRAMYLLLAESLEAQFEFNSARPDRAIRKLFDPFKGGKKKGKNISVASELALKIGTRMEQSGKGIHSLKIYQRALDLWQKADDEENILVMSEGMLAF